VSSPPFTWGQKQIQFPKRRVSTPKNTGRCKKSKNPVILYAIHQRQNPLRSNYLLSVRHRKRCLTSSTCLATYFVSVRFATNFTRICLCCGWTSCIHMPNVSYATPRVEFAFPCDGLRRVCMYFLSTLSVQGKARRHWSCYINFVEGTAKIFMAFIRIFIRVAV
jgi:hypothetical protein